MSSPCFWGKQQGLLSFQVCITVGLFNPQLCARPPPTTSAPLRKLHQKWLVTAQLLKVPRDVYTPLSG